MTAAASGLDLRQRVERWWLQRQTPTDTCVLGQRNVYILPTRSGLMFGLTQLALLVASINYQLNLGFVLTFLLAGAAIASMHMTHATLRGLTLRLKPPAPVFAGDAATLEIVLSHAGRARYGVEISEALGRSRERRAARRSRDWRRWLGLPGAEPAYRRSERSVTVDVPAASQADARLMLSMPARGLHPSPALRVETRFPFGLFRAWAIWRPAATVLVYPQPERMPPPLPAAQAGPATSESAVRAAGAEPDGVRAYRRGDTMRQIVWKKAARTGELVSREGSASARLSLWLDPAAAQAGDPEASLSRLAAWVLAADRSDVLYGLRLPPRELPPDTGDTHRHAALKALALWPEG